jgi:flagellar assembly factor FliW
MITIEKTRTDGPVQAPDREGLAPADTGLEIHFLTGLLGFEACKHFRLIRDEDLEPYQWMKGLDDEQAFLVIPPGYVVDNYNIEISDEDQKLLGLKNTDDAMVLNIATWHPDETVTINLKGPIVYHKETLQARQVIPLNAPDLSLAHPMGN